MYPGDDHPLRIRLLINECRELRLRLAERIEQSRALRARAVQLRDRAGAPAAEAEERRIPEEGQEIG
jgi:regulator of replication initiation timing